MDPVQQVFNIVFGVAGALAGWWMKAMWESLIALRVADDALSGRVAALHILVAGEYVKRSDMESIANELYVKLDKIYDKLDGKADK